jgi:hypothetical protein
MANIVLVNVYVNQGKIKLELSHIFSHSGIMIGLGPYYDLHPLSQKLFDLGFFKTIEKFNAAFINERIEYRFRFRDAEINYKQNLNGNLEHERIDTITYTLPSNPILCLYLFQALSDYLQERDHQVYFFPVSDVAALTIERTSEADLLENEPEDKHMHPYYQDYHRKENAKVELLPMTQKELMALFPKPESDKPVIVSIAKQLISKLEEQGKHRLASALEKVIDGANQSADIAKNLSIEHMFNWLYGLNIGELFDPNTSKEQNDQLLIQLQQALDRDNDADQFPLLLTIIGAQAKHNLYAQCIGLPDPNKDGYTWHFTEWSLLSGAKFELRPDGKMNLYLKESLGYRQHYARGQRNHSKLKCELDHLFQLLKLEVVDSPDYHNMITFNQKSAETLANMGLCIDSSYQPVTKPKAERDGATVKLSELSFLNPQGRQVSPLPSPEEPSVNPNQNDKRLVK